MFGKSSPLTHRPRRLLPELNRRWLIGILVLGSLWTAYCLWPRYEVHLEIQDKLYATISTPQLVMRSIGAHDTERMRDLFTTPEIMHTLADVPSFSPQVINYTLQRRWFHKWTNHIPYSGFAVFEKGSHQFIGFIRLEHTSINIKPGQLEVAYAVLKPFQGKGYASEMVRAVVHHYLPLVREAGYKVENEEPCEIIARILKTNKASARVLEKNGFKILPTEGEYNTFYIYPLS